MTPIEALNNALPQLNDWEKSFAYSMIDQFNRKRSLSDKQWAWVEKLAKRPNEPKPEVAKVGDPAALLELFNKAAKFKKVPAIVLNVKDAGDVRLSVAGSRARVPGSINVVRNGAEFGEGWFGRITLEGVFEPSRKETAPPTLMPALQELLANPVEITAKYGRLSKRCCFCNTKLSDPRSELVGYGQTCANHWGLPWGAKS